jgi:hypothetical protein
MAFSHILLACLLGPALTGCGGGVAPRLMDLVGKDAFVQGGTLPETSTSIESEEWRKVPAIGLMVHSDATGTHAAPPIRSTDLDILARRAEAFLRQRCSFQEIVPVRPLSQPVNLPQELKSQGPHVSVPYVMVIVFSSREMARPEKMGHATMMTQMVGTVIENTALVEIGILRLSDFTMVFSKSGRANDRLEQLAAPIASDGMPPEDARALLRAQTGQQALDRALYHVGSGCPA